MYYLSEKKYNIKEIINKLFLRYLFFFTKKRFSIFSGNTIMWEAAKQHFFNCFIVQEKYSDKNRKKSLIKYRFNHSPVTRRKLRVLPTISSLPVNLLPVRPSRTSNQTHYFRRKSPQRSDKHARSNPTLRVANVCSALGVAMAPLVAGRNRAWIARMDG